MTSVVLDASVVLALLLDEPGANIVKAALVGAAMTSVNLAEVVSHFARRDAAEAAIHRVIDPLPIEIMAFDEALAFASGMTIPLTRPAGLSLGDRACLALASQLHIPALTADRAWLNVASALGVEVTLIR